MSLHLDVDVRDLERITPSCLENRDHAMQRCINGELVCIYCLMEIHITKAFFFDRLEIISHPSRATA